MRRQHFAWTYLVLATVLSIYGCYSLIYNHVHKGELSILALVFLIVGVTMLIVFFILFFISYFSKKKEQPVIHNSVQEEDIPEYNEAPVQKEEKIEETPAPSKKTTDYSKEVAYERSSSYRSRPETIYVRQVGYGPILRVEGSRILDMRTNTYYRIQGNMVYQEGSGPLYEINGNSIRSTFGGYLYEISGSNINKTFGGFYASISGSYITLYDSSIKYELSDSLSLKQQLAVVALLFGNY